jgi:NAD-dependent oxidoreductase involved in siderophore biosynthesis
MSNTERRVDDAVARAALSVGESLAIALVECGMVGKQEIICALEDAASAHRNAAEEGLDEDVNTFAAAVIERMIRTLNAAHDN